MLSLLFVFNNLLSHGLICLMEHIVEHISFFYFLFFYFFIFKRVLTYDVHS